MSCPHCGGQNGMHVWAGSGQCPGMQEEVYAKTRAEIERLKGEIEKLERHWAADHLRLTGLCARAADAISIREYDDLVRELREAAK